SGGDQRLTDSGPAVHPLECPDVEVLARMRARHQCDLGWLEVERLDPACLDEGDDAERLDAAPQIRDAIRVPEPADQDSVDVGLDDVAAMDTFLDSATDLADKDRCGASGRTGRRGPTSTSARPRLRRRHGGGPGGPG